MRSSTCKGSNGQYLEEYHSEMAAEMGAAEAQRRYGNSVTPVQCRKCGYWHLTVASTRRQCMFCTDSSMSLKDVYTTREEAQRTSDYLKKEKRVLLSPYKCPHGSGWHLTKTK